MVRNWTFSQPWLCYKVTQFLQLNPHIFGLSKELQDSNLFSPGRYILGISSYNILVISAQGCAGHALDKVISRA